MAPSEEIPEPVVEDSVTKKMVVLDKEYTIKLLTYLDSRPHGEIRLLIDPLLEAFLKKFPRG